MGGSSDGEIDGETETETDGLTLELGLKLADALELGDGLVDGLSELDGETEGETEGLTLADASAKFPTSKSSNTPDVPPVFLMESPPEPLAGMPAFEPLILSTLFTYPVTVVPSASSLATSLFAGVVE